jgi:hypothetical protein
MKLRHLALLVLLATLTVMPACSVAYYPGGPTLRGMIYADIDSPVQSLAVTIDPAAKPTKRGTAATRALLGLFAWGDGSVEAAMKDAGITRIHHIDHNAKQFLSGFWSSDTTIVYGE